MSSEEKMGQINFTFWPGGENPHERRTELSFDIPSDADIDELCDCFTSFLVALGYHPNTINKYIPGSY